MKITTTGYTSRRGEMHFSVLHTFQASHQPQPKPKPKPKTFVSVVPDRDDS